MPTYHMRSITEYYHRTSFKMYAMSYILGIFLLSGKAAAAGQQAKALKQYTVCNLPAEVGPCRGTISRFYYNPSSGECEGFTYGGCDGNANNFATKEDCQNACDICSLSADVGPCDNNVPRYFHNSATGKCEQFTYGGCDGNANRFLTLEECQLACDCGHGICSLKADVGPCEALILRYYHNPASRQCEEFTYGGCDGNANNFLTKAACQKACVSVCDICQLEKDIGPCDGVDPQYYFNSVTGSCESFTYGGCGGNANNFETQEECRKACDICSLKPDVGPCDGKFNRYFYNAATGKCERFTYGGCEGNANNFMTKAECKQECTCGKYGGVGDSGNK